MAEIKIVLTGVDQAGGVIEHVTGALGGLGSLAAGALTAGLAVGVAGVAALAGGLAYSVKEAMEAQQIQAQLAAVLESTGGKAGITAAMVNELASSLAGVTTFTDDSILAGQNLLLTFTNIGADVFPTATQAMLDMATAMGGDPQSQAILLGKALNDPVAGLSALTRVGVAFTEEQKETIKTMVEAGNVAGAQAIILGELNTEFGGSAQAQMETFAGKWQNLQNRLSDAAETVGTAVLPLLTTLFDSVIAPAIPIIETIAGAFASFFEGLASGEDPMGDVANLVYEIANALGLDGGGAFAAVTGLRDEFETLTAFLATNVPIAIAAVSGFIAGTLIPAIGSIIAWLQVNLPPAIAAASAFFTGTLVPALQAAWAFIQDPLIPILSQIVQWLAVNIPPAVATAARFFNDVILPALHALWDFQVNVLIPAIASLVVWLMDNIPPAAQKAADFFNTVILPALNQVWAFIQDPLIPTVASIIAWLQENLPPAIQAASDFFNNVLLPALQAIWGFIQDPLVPLMQALADVYFAGLNLAMAGIEAVWRLVLKPALEALWGYFSEHILPILSAVAGIISETLAPIIVTFVNGALKVLTEKMEWLSGVLSGIAQFFRDIIALIQGMPDVPGLPGIGGPPGPQIPGGGGHGPNFGAGTGGGGFGGEPAWLPRFEASAARIEAAVRELTDTLAFAP